MNKKYESIINIKETSDNVIFLFHGTGADATDLLPLATHLDPESSIISVNGNVFSNGLRRYFDRDQNGIDLQDLEKRSHELAEYLRDVIHQHDLQDKCKIAIGYSNGANIIIGMMQTEARLFDRVGILHGLPYLDMELQDVQGMDAFVSLGENDPIIDPEETMRLVKEMNTKGISVSIYSHQDGHALTSEEMEALQSWYHS